MECKRLKGNKIMKIFQLPGGDEVHHYKKSLVVCFKGKRKVLSTGPNNGGYRTDLRAVFNNDGNPGPGMACTMRADTSVSYTHLDVYKRQLCLSVRTWLRLKRHLLRYS